MAYTIETVPGVITRYALLHDGVHVFSSPDRAAVEAMRDVSESVGDDDFLRGYIQAIYFTDTGKEEQPDHDAPMAPEARARCVEDCEAFKESFAELLAQAYATGYTAEQAGIDFWLTRNGHGSGFWDRGLGDLGDELTRDAKPFGGVDVYATDSGDLAFM